MNEYAYHGSAPGWHVTQGDCLDVMRAMPAGSVDAVVTDPPYGLGFMGKAWDSFAPRDMPMARSGPLDSVNAGAARQGGRQRACGDYQARMARNSRAFQAANEAWAVEALRVAKPGAHLLAFGGTRTFHRLTCAIEDAGFEIRDCLSWLYGSGFPKSHNLDGKHDGWGTALKPAWEPIVLARKPLTGTVAANVEKHGVGALNIDGTRIDGPKAGGSGQPPLSFGGTNHRPFHDTAEPREFDATNGRWPANVALDEEAAAMLDEQSGCVAGAVSNGKAAGTGFGGDFGAMEQEASYGDFGGASRFFYTAKASRGEREAGLREAGLRGTLGNFPDDPGKSGAMNVRNTHPTVKPVDLMRWLVRLVAPVGSLVLDPFMGSGTTGVACVEEGCRFHGVEREKDYLDISTARLTAASRQSRMPFKGTT